MKHIIFLVLLTSCASKKIPENRKDMVSVQAALMQARASYMKGCVDGLKELKVPIAFPGCRDKSILHLKELEGIMDQEL
jgi:hypothetical protein